MINGIMYSDYANALTYLLITVLAADTVLANLIIKIFTFYIALGVC